MAIPAFRNGRMFVGWRLRDYKLVYYKPYEEEVGEDEAGDVYKVSLFFVNPSGEEDGPMMEGEVLFLPHFAYENCESKWLRERKAIQIRNLMTAHELYEQKDPVVYKRLMDEAEDLGWARWRSIMTEIKRFKNPIMKTKVTKQARKEQRRREMEMAGIPQDMIEDELTSDDSGFEDEDFIDLQSRRGPRPTKSASMGPPSRKRTYHDGNDTFGPAKKQKKKKSEDRKRYGPSPTRSDDLFMIGGLGDDDSDNARAREQRSRSLSSLNNGISRDESLTYDPAPPRGHGPSHRSRDRDTDSESSIVDKNAERPEATGSNIERWQHLAGHTRTEEELREIFHGGLSEQEAINQAIRESVQPEDRPWGDVSESTEDQNGESRTNEGAARRLARSEARSGSSAADPEQSNE